MISRAITPRRQGRRAITLLAVAGLVAGTVITSSLALATSPGSSGHFELDKNATGDLTVSHLGTLKSQINSTTATVFDVCQRTPTLPFDPTPPLAVGVNILIDAEEMVIASVGASSTKTGGCSFTDPSDTVSNVRTYTVLRAQNSTTAAKHPGGADVSTLIPDAKDGVDWDEVYLQYNAHIGDDNPCAAIADSVACSWLADPPGESAFTGGSADILDIPGWTWTDMSVPDADEILHAYAIKFSNDDQFLYFGADRYAVNGAKDMGFWFFKSPVHAAPDGSFVDDDGNPAVHQDGDILLLGTFTQGGAVSTIRVYKWVGTGGSDGSLNEAGNFGDCVPGSAGDNGCNTVNSTTVKSPWTYQGKGSTAAAGVIYGGGFMEGGVDLGALDLQGCFSSFMAETRSSPSLTAAQKDFTLGRFESCTADVVTTPSDATVDHNPLVDSDAVGDPGYLVPDVEIGAGSAGVDITDSATVSIEGTDTWAGTLDFYLCGPIATDATCATGGVKIDSQSIDEDTDQPIVSASANLTSIGYYCWRADFTSATDGVPDGSDASDGECFDVTPVTPDLSTQTVDDTGSDVIDESVPFGTTLYDKATLDGTANEPGDNGGEGIDSVQTIYTSINATDGPGVDGTITFTLVGPDTESGTVCDPETPASGSPSTNNPEDVDVDSGEGDYTTSGFTPEAAGDFHWIASYDGSTSGNTTGTDHNTTCEETGEDVTVLQLQPTMDTAQDFIPNDSATITVDAGAGDLDGSVSFYLWVEDTSCGSGDIETADQSFKDIGVSDTDDAGDTTLTDTASTDNTTAYKASGPTTFSWMVVFSSNNEAHKGITGTCNNENSSITIDNGSTEPSS